MQNKIKSVLITLSSIIIFTLGILGVLIWGINTLSQNKALTTKFIKFQIHRLLDLESEVINPHAYVDWDLQYKIRADKLTFINNKSDLVSVEKLQVNVFLPYFFLKKIYITQMVGDNLYVDFERYENNKLNIIEIFNITGFFKVYFQNSSISINKYFFDFTDNYHKPAEKMVVTGENILLSKFTHKKYLQLIMDGTIDYNKSITPFLINYNLKMPNAKEDYNLEVNLPNFDAKVFDNYLKEFLPNSNVDIKGKLNLKSIGSKYFHISADINKLKFSSPKVPISFDYRNKFSLFSRFAVENKNIIFDEVNVLSKDLNVNAYGRINDYSKKPVDLKVYVKAVNSSAKEALKLLPKGLPPLNYAIDKAKKYDVDALVNAEILAEGKIGQLDINGNVDIDNITLGFEKDLPVSSAKLDFKNEKMFLDAILYPNYTKEEFVKVFGEVKTTQPVVLGLNVQSSEEVSLAKIQKPLNLFSDVFNFTTGPVPFMDVKRGQGNIELSIKGTPPFVYLDGKMDMYNGLMAYEGLYGYIDNVSGQIDFAGKNIYYKDIKGQQAGVKAYAYGQTQIHNNGLSNFYLSVPNMPLDHAKVYIDNSPLIKEVSTALAMIEKPQGVGSLNLMFESEKDKLEPYVKGDVVVKNGSCNITDIAYRAENISGRVDFDTNESLLDFDGKVHGVDTKLFGSAKKDYSDITIETPVADVVAAYEFLYNSPMFVDIKSSFDDFSNFSGKVRTSTRLTGKLDVPNPTFTTVVDVIEGKLRYLDIKEDVFLTSGQVIAEFNKVLMKDLEGTVYNAPFKLNGTVLNAGTKDEKADMIFEIENVAFSGVEKIIGTKLLLAEQNELLSKFNYQSGTIDVKAYINELETKTNVIFHDALLCVKESQKKLTLKSGEFFFSEELLKANDFSVQMDESNILLDGDIKNYQTKPDLNIKLSSDISGKDFNEILVPIFNLPLNLIGKLYLSLNFKGNIDDWNIKMRAMLDDASYIFYKGANIGEGLSKFMFFDISAKDDDIVINTLDIFSSNYNNTNKPEILAQVQGKIKNIKNTFPYIDNLEVIVNDYMNISFLNILFYNPSKPLPLLKDGGIKGKVFINGYANDLTILGDAEVKEAVLSTINTTIEKMHVEFNENEIAINDANINIADSKATINALLENKFVMPVAIKKLDLKAQTINIDKVVENLSLLIDKEKMTNIENSAKASTSYVTIDEGKVDIAEFIYSGLAAHNFKADFKITPQWDCIVENIDTQITKGTLNGNVLYNLYSSDLSGHINAQTVMANAFASTFLNLPNEISGEMDGTVNFKTRGKTHEEIIKNLNGDASFKLYNGRMLRLGSVEYMLRIANTFKGGLARLNLNAIVNLVAPKTGYFDNIEGKILIKDGTILTDKVTFGSNELNLFLTGTYNMNNSVVNGIVLGQMPKESKESVLWLGPLGKISLNSLMKQLSKTAEKQQENNLFFINPLVYLETISGLQTKKSDYHFFVVTLDGNLYTEKYVKKFKWLK